MAENDQDFNIPDVVKSRLIANKVINQSWLAQNGLQTNLIELWDLNKIPFYVLNKNTIDSSYVIEKAINKFNDHIEVSENSMSGLISIDFWTSSGIYFFRGMGTSPRSSSKSS